MLRKDGAALLQVFCEFRCPVSGKKALRVAVWKSSSGLDYDQINSRWILQRAKARYRCGENAAATAWTKLMPFRIILSGT
jgi:hypothetical protein